MADFDGTAIDELLSGAVVSGALAGAVMVVGDREETLYEGAAGKLPDGTQTIFRIASMTKALTTVAMLQLVEEGLLGRDSEVASIVPSFGELQVLDGFDGDTPRLRPPARQATIQQLLTHTSGCGYFFSNAELRRWHELTETPHVLTGLERSLHVPLIADPGTRWEYGISADWAGQVIEAVLGQDLETVFAERICGPLGMTDTTFLPDDAQRMRLPPVKSRWADGSLQDSAMELPEPEFYSGGGGLVATASDYLRLLRALLRGGELDGARILGTEYVEMMFSDQLHGIPLPELMRSADPELTNDVPKLPFAQGWGCGLQLILEDIPGMRRAGTGNWAGLLNSYYWIDRTSGVTAALFTQVLPFFDARVVETALGAELAVYAQLGAGVA
jgi:methyl acetate hydrolase